MKFSIDSNTISYYFRGDPCVVPKLQALSPVEVTVPSIVVYELQYGLRRLPTEAGRERLRALRAFLKPLEILPFNENCAELAAEIRSDLEKRGIPIGPHDILIAATAIGHNAKLVTRNTREFSRIKALELVNWHEPA